MTGHEDVAAYALGVLDPRDSSRFEEHLADCAACAAELESMLPVVDLLSDVDPDSLVATEQSRKDGAVLHRMIDTVGQERRRARSRHMFSLAAAAVLLAALTGGALAAGGRWLAPGPSTPIAQPSAASTDSPWDRLPPDGGLGDGNGTGERFSTTDPRTGVRADVALESKPWGTQVSFAVWNVKGPLTCRLLAVRTSGKTELLSTWKVPEGGYGTAAQPQPLTLQAATALPRGDLAHVQVQALDAGGNPSTLVTVPG